MPTPTEYQKQISMILRGQLICSCQAQDLFAWILGEKTYDKPFDKLKLLESLQQLETSLKRELNEVTRIAEAVLNSYDPQ